MTMSDEEVGRTVDNLGNSPYEIASSLQELGILGTRYAAGSCPIANYVKTLVPEAYAVASWESTSWVTFPDGSTEEDDEISHLAEHSATVFEFQHMFDRGGFPGLEESDEQEIN